jgi:uncharacterized protein involved in exopolysaccharide biosynthesis
MQVFVEQDRSDPAISAGQSAAAVNNKLVTVDQVNSEVELLQGRDMLRSAAETCNLVDNKWSLSDIFMPSDPQQQQAMKLEDAANGLAKNIKVEAAPTSDVINVKYGRVGDRETPACVLQALNKRYLAKHLQLRRPAGSSDFFAQETDKAQAALAKAEARVANFSRESGVAAPDILRTDMAQEVATSESALHAAQQATAADQMRLEDLKSQMQSTPSRSPTAETSNAANILLQELQATLLSAQLKRTNLLMKYDPSYPLVQEEDQEIVETQAAIQKAQESKFVNQTSDRDPTYELLRQDTAKTEADLASQKATASALVNSIRSMRQEMVTLDGQAVQQSALIRDAKAGESTYLLYLNKREQERTSDALDRKSIANVAIAVAPVVPTLPAHSPTLVLWMGLFGAILTGIGSAFLAEYLDPSFRTPQEVMEILNMPVLASVPKKAA